MKYITLFETAAAYNAATLDLPNVSLVEENMSVSYKPYVPETRVVAKYNVTDTSSSTVLRANFEENIFKSMEIDGVMLDELVTEYTFDTTGEHTVKYELYDETKLGNNAPVFYNNNLVEIIIPNSVTSICTNALLNCSGLTSVTIPNSVTSIGGNAFDSCSGLTSCTIGSGVTSIGHSAFSGTDALKVLNYNAKYELSSSFRGAWPNLETVIIGDSTPTIGSQFFQGCSRLTSVTIGNSVTSIDSSAFKDCSSLTSIDIPDSVTNIGEYTFRDCSSLTSVTIGNGVTSIGNGAFSGCSSLTSIDIPDNVTSIGTSAFEDCSGLTNITSYAITAPYVYYTTFVNIKTGGILTVPSGSTGYDRWMLTDNYYLGKYSWNKIEQ